MSKFDDVMDKCEAQLREQKMRPDREQPFYHLFAENEESSYLAYVSQQNLLPDADNGPVDHPDVTELFHQFANGRYTLRRSLTH